MKNKQDLILTQALKLVPFDGWSEATLGLAAKKAGLDEKYARIAFPGGAMDAVVMFIDQIDAKMEAQLKKQEFDKIRVRDKIFVALKTRFEIYAKYKVVMRKTSSFMLMPQNISASIKRTWKTADKIWYLAGDNASDFNHYTKRTLLSGIYSATFIYWLNDNSDGHKSTWEFLQRRINNVMVINKVKAKISKIM